MKIRVIPTILVRNFGVVKTIQFGQYRPLGVATNFARVYNSRGVDELIVLDIDATREDRGPDLESIKDIAEECYMPFAYGGGIRTLEDVREIIKSGADKIVINTQALKSPDLITEISKSFGAQCVIVSIDAKLIDGQYMVMSNGGSDNSGRKVVDWILKVQALGAGEIFLNSIDRDGTMQGYDMDLVHLVAPHVHIPLIVGGGAGELKHFVELTREKKVAAVSCASVFHYTQITPYAIKECLNQNGVDVRLV